MFARMLEITRSTDGGPSEPVPVAWLDSFAMRNFTNHSRFDDTLPVADGRLEAGYRVPLGALAAAMEQWFRRKGWLRSNESLLVVEQGSAPARLESPQAAS